MQEPLKGFLQGAIHKRRLLKGGGRGVKNARIYLVKRRQRGWEGGHKVGNMGRHHLWMAPNPSERNIHKGSLPHSCEHVC